MQRRSPTPRHRPTAANQTKAQYFDTGTRETVNDWLRDGAPLVAGTPVSKGTLGATRIGDSQHPVHHLADVADIFETARNSGIWKTDGTAARWTADGIHPSAYGYSQAAAQAVRIDRLL